MISFPCITNQNAFVQKKLLDKVKAFNWHVCFYRSQAQNSPTIDVQKYDSFYVMHFQGDKHVIYHMIQIF